MATDSPAQDFGPDGIVFAGHWMSMSLMTWIVLSLFLKGPLTGIYRLLAHFPYLGVFSAFITLIAMVAAFTAAAQLIGSKGRRRIALVYVGTVLTSAVLHFGLWWIVAGRLPSPD